MTNASLSAAKSAKNDKFYIQLNDIEGGRRKGGK